MRTPQVAPLLLAPLFAAAFVACDPSAGDRQGIRAGQCDDDVDATCDDDGQDTEDNPHDTDDDGQDTEDNPHDTDDGVDTDHDCADTASSVDDHCGDTDDDDDTDGDDDDTDGDDGEADLPYDVKLALGDSFALGDAFLEKGPAPMAIVSVEMEGGDWRLAELQAGTSFVVDQGDCDHVGNRDVGRDRVFVTWQNADGSQETDHLDLRYCEQ